MGHAVFAMDTYFCNSLGSYEFNARCEMLKELGFDGTYLTLWNDHAWSDLKDLPGVKSKHGLDVAAVYVTLDLAGDGKHEGNQRIAKLVETLEGCNHIEISVRSSESKPNNADPQGNEKMKRWLDKFLPVASQRGVTLSLYPHINFWLDRIEISTRLCLEYNHPSLRTTFCGFHWYAIDGKNLPSHLQDAAPYLRWVNLCGTRRNAKDNPMPATIEPLDEGEMDNFAVLGLLRQVGYKGAVGFQGYAIGGDAYSYLKRSLAAFRDMERRLDAHPNWAKLRFA